jgi:hypothetical protein
VHRLDVPRLAAMEVADQVLKSEEAGRIGHGRSTTNREARPVGFG